MLQTEIDALLRAFNGEKSPRQRRLVKILEEMIELANLEPPIFYENIEGPPLVRGKLNPGYRRVAPEKYARHAQIEALTAAINNKLAQYRFTPVVLTSYATRGLSVVWRHENVERPRSIVSSDKAVERPHVELILNLALSGQLKRLRRCDNCQSWLYARFRHQVFCSSKCQQKRFIQSEEWRAHRRVYMRDYHQKMNQKRVGQ